MVVALLKFRDGLTTGADGEAFISAVGQDVTIENADDTGVGSWKVSLLFAPPGCARTVVPGAPGVLQAESSSSTVQTVLLNLEAGYYGCYRIMLEVWSRSNYTGEYDVDIRNIGVKTPSSAFVLPPYQKQPDPLPLTGSGSKPNELNFDGQPYGWAGDDSIRLTNGILLALDTVSGADVKVGVTIADTTPGYLDAKVASGALITKVVQSPGGSESLSIGITPGTTGQVLETAVGPIPAWREETLVISPPQITADVNDYAPTDWSTADVMYFDADAERTITGFSGTALRVRKVLVNDGGFSVFLANQDVGSSASNQILTSNGSSLEVPPNGMVHLIRDVDLSKWRATTGGGATSALVTDSFVATAGQTVFPLSQPPLDAVAWVNIEGILQLVGSDFTVVGSSLTYSGDQTLEAGQDVQVMYLHGRPMGTPYVHVLAEGAQVGLRPKINLIQGAHVTLTVTDNPGQNRVDATVGVTGLVSSQSVTAPTLVSALTSGTKHIVYVDTSDVGWAANDDITLPPVLAIDTIVVVKDIGGSADSKPIDINGNGNNIDGQPLQTISTVRGYLVIVGNAVEWSVIGMG